jgi:alkanesulfonate monooxygenase SsuD/methylene tetrahydromethanopterin reductase-like flavin-dependent oxidoreductase (luciferase family)
VRLHQQFATVDLLSGGRAEIIAGRGSFTESFPLFGAELTDYEALYEEKLDLLLRVDAGGPITWSGRFRPPLTGARVFPQPFREHLAISVGTGGNAESSVRAGVLGLPVVYAIIGGAPEGFVPLADLYRRASAATGHPTASQHVTFSGIGLLAPRSQDAKDRFYPHWLRTMEDGAAARGWRVPSRSDYDRYTAGAGAVFAGSPAEVAERIITVGRLAGAQRYGLQMDWSGVPHPDVMRAIELLGTQVRPIVEAELGAEGDVHAATVVRPGVPAREPVGA